MDNRPVGVYDSGLGGLTVWREIRRQLPEESLVYLGDGKNCPYGARPADEICRLADEAVGRLVGAGCKMVVVACNTATAAAIDFLRRKYRQMPGAFSAGQGAVHRACIWLPAYRTAPEFSVGQGFAAAPGTAAAHADTAGAGSIRPAVSGQGSVPCCGL